MSERRANGAGVESGASRAMTFARLHRGLPDEAPWFFHVALRSRAFLIVTLVVTALFAVIAASNPEWLLRFDQPVSDWVRGGGEQLSLAKLVTQLGSPNLAIAVGLAGVALLWRRCRASAVTLGVLIAAALSVDIVLKLVVDRARPPRPGGRYGAGVLPQRARHPRRRHLRARAATPLGGDETAACSSGSVSLCSLSSWCPSL